MAGFLCREIPLPYAVDEELLYCLRGGAVFLEAPHNGSKDLLQWLRARLTLGGILCTVFDDLAARHTVLHVYVGAPC